MTQRICCLVFARLNSTRVPNKLLQDVGGVTLLNRGLRYLVRLREACSNVTPVVCCPKYDQELFDSCLDAQVECWCDPTTAAKSWPELIAPHVDHLRLKFDWVWDANVFCHPFLKLETGKRIVSEMEVGPKFVPFTVTICNRGLAWDRYGVRIIGDGQLADTKNNPLFYTPAHIAYCWHKHFLGLSSCELSRSVSPRYIPLDWAELIDIDTPEDLEHARAVAGSLPLER